MEENIRRGDSGSKAREDIPEGRSQVEALRAPARTFVVTLGAKRGRKKNKLGAPWQWVAERTQEKGQLFTSRE